MDALIEEYLDYNPDEDYNGAQGIELANQTCHRYGLNFNKIKIKMSLERLKRILDEKLSK